MSKSQSQASSITRLAFNILSEKTHLALYNGALVIGTFAFMHLRPIDEGKIPKLFWILQCAVFLTLCVAFVAFIPNSG